MKIINEIIEFTKVVADKTSNIDDLVDLSLEPIKDYTDTISDVITPIKSLISIINLRRKITLKAFLKSYSKKLNENYKIDTKEIEKLTRYFEKEKNLQFISEIIDNALYSKSVKCSSILGVIAGKFIKNKKDFKDLDLMLIGTLREINDKDIDNFILLYENAPKIEKYKLEKWNLYQIEFRIREIFNEKNPISEKIDKLSLELTIEKLKRTNALTYSEGGIGSVGNARGAFMFSTFTKELYEVIINTMPNNQYNQ